MRTHHHISVLRKAATFIGLGLLAAALCGPAPASAQQVDPHQLYEEKCAGCHQSHAGEFVHEKLLESDGEILGRTSGRELRAFLESGHGGLTPAELEIILRHLTAIQRSGRVFHDKCLICHDRAVNLARSKLIIRDGKLVGRYTDRDIAEFLSDHGRLTDDEIPKVVEVLKRQLAPQGSN